MLVMMMMMMMMMMMIKMTMMTMVNRNIFILSCSLCQALGQCRRAKKIKRGSSTIANERQKA